MDSELNHRRWGRRWPSLPGLSPIREVPMATTSTSRPAVATITQAVFASGADDARDRSNGR
jgi:hypothetical protein